MQASASMTAATAAGTAADGPPAKKKRGSSGLPRGVTQTGSSKFQGRINWMPPGSRRGQRSEALGRSIRPKRQGWRLPKLRQS